MRGPAHAKDKRPNEDAWCVRITLSGALAVVCDGMGSRPAARFGARMAVAACKQAWAHWRRAPVGSAEDLVRLIEVLWRLRLGNTPPEDAATTCLVCALRADGSGALLQLGDGLMGLRRADGTFSAITPERDGFASFSHALGTPHNLRNWHILELAPMSPGMAILLTTDGISDDLVPERRSGFVDWLVKDVAAMSTPSRALAKALRAWPVPHHRDDKTLIALWRP